MSTPRRSLMVGLYYPAVLGAGLVFILTRLALLFPERRSEDVFWVSHARQVMNEFFDTFWNDYGVWWGILFLVLFSASFVVTDELPEDRYSHRFFVLDICEVVLIFFVYWMLGLADTTKMAPPFFPGVYVAMALILFIDELWSRSIPVEVVDSRERSRSVSAVRWTGIVMFIIAGVGTSIPSHESGYAWLVYRVFVVVLLLYLLSYIEWGRQANAAITRRIHLH